LLRVRTPEISEEYREKLSIDLTQEEAVFLRGQITSHQRESLIGQILKDGTRMSQVLQLPETASFDEFSELPFIGGLKSSELRSTVHHARDFWRIMEGAHIRYNCLLQAAGFGTSELKAKFDEQWETWREKIAGFPPHWDSTFMWALSPPTRKPTQASHPEIHRRLDRTGAAWCRKSQPLRRTRLKSGTHQQRKPRKTSTRKSGSNQRLDRPEQGRISTPPGDSPHSRHP
jgi:hypothetical protein